MADSYSYPSKKKALELVEKAPGDLVLVAGPTGAGKSSLCNAALGKDQSVENIKARTFPEGAGLGSETVDIKIVTGKWLGDSSKGDVTVADTPGLLDSQRRTDIFLTGLLDILENFPPRRLRLIVITVPLTEQRANSTYSDMLELVDNIFRPEGLKPIWEHVCFVFTCVNLVSESALQKREEWIEFFKESGVKNPFTVTFKYGDPHSLEPLRQKFESLAPYTPKSTTEIASFVKLNPNASVKEKMEQNETWRKLREDLANKLEEARKSNEDIVKQLEEKEKLSSIQANKLIKAEAALGNLEKQIEDLRNRPPQVIYLPSSDGGSNCSIC